MMNILVVDDEPEILHFVGAVLEDEGFNVDRAGDGQEALEMASVKRPDLVVLDMGLPRLAGDAVAREIRRAQGDVPILLITADGSAEEKALRIGAFDYLQKPFDLDLLVDIVRRRLLP